MAFKLIYVDDYGNTGNRLDDPQQPIFMLLGLLVDSKNWSELEAELWEHIKQVAHKAEKTLGSFELHAWQLFSNRNPTFSKIPLDERAEIALAIAETVRNHGGRYIGTYVQKSDIADRLRVATSRSTVEFLADLTAEAMSPAQVASTAQNFRGFQVFRHSPYVICLANLVVEIDEILAGLGDQGALILDRQDQFVAAHQMKAFTTLRAHKKFRLNGLLEQPLQGDGRYNYVVCHLKEG